MVGGPARIGILRILSEQPRDPFTIHELVRRLHISRTNADSTLWRMVRAGQVAHVGKGLYQHPTGLVVPGAPDPRLRIHALKLEARTVRKWGDGASRQLSRIVTDSFPQIEGGLHRHPNNGSLTLRAEWANRRLTITAHPRHDSGLLEIFLEASLRPMHLLEVHSYLAGFIPAKFDLPPEFWLVTQADWNIDIPGSVKTDLSLTGISVAAFERLILKVYQKAEDLVRVEARSFEPIQADRLISYLEGVLFALAQAREAA